MILGKRVRAGPTLSIGTGGLKRNDKEKINLCKGMTEPQKPRNRHAGHAQKEVLSNRNFPGRQKKGTKPAFHLR